VYNEARSMTGIYLYVSNQMTLGMRPYLLRPTLQTTYISLRPYRIVMSRPASTDANGDLKRHKTGLAPLDASRLVVKRNENPRTCPDAKDLVFGRTFTNHMLTVPWNNITGWGEPKIEAYGPFQMDPSTTVLHYASTLFEGLKAYRDPQNKIRLFRPYKNMERMNRSAERLCLPTFDGDELIKLIKKLVDLDQDWVPKEDGYSLYIRPTLIGAQPSLGVSDNTEALLFVILSPVGPYYSTGVKPVALEANLDYVRAWPGGSGNAKLGANYAPSVLPAKEAASRGYQQILWLFGEEHWLTEVGTMNMFVVLKKDNGILEVVTPPLNGMILPGVTRDSILEMLRDHQAGKIQIEGVPEIEVNEREINMKEILEASKNGTLEEMFGAGTAAVVSPVDKIGYNGQDIKVPVTSSGFGIIAEPILKQLSNIQWGKIDHPWSITVESD